MPPADGTLKAQSVQLSGARQQGRPTFLLCVALLANGYPLGPTASAGAHWLAPTSARSDGLELQATLHKCTVPLALQLVQRRRGIDCGWPEHDVPIAFKMPISATYADAELSGEVVGDHSFQHDAAAASIMKDVWHRPQVCAEMMAILILHSGVRHPGNFARNLQLARQPSFT